MTKKKLVILGGGESGVGAATLGVQQGFDVFLSDFGQIEDQFRNELQELGIEFEEQNHTDFRILSAELIVKSPGIPETASIVQKIRETGIELISEVEFASQYTNAPIIAITGSNGKTTTTAIIHHMFEKAEMKAALCGNIGKSFARLVAEGGYNYYVVEVSSFQLDDINSFKPKVAVLTNLSADHLERYEYKFENYIASKFRITEFQDSSDTLVYGADDQEIQNYFNTHSINATTIPFGLETAHEEGGYTHENQFIINIKKKFKMSIRDLSLRGNHNVYNSLAAGIVAKAFDISDQVVRDSLIDFESIEHRLEFVGTFKGIEFINDSKATNVNSAWYALESMTKPVIWIAGGIDKGNDYSVLQPLVRKKVKAIICLGQDNLALHSAFSKCVDVMMNTENAREAVRLAQHLGNKGDAVLLAPACSSFDLFKNYEDRGNQFKLAVREL